MGKKCKLEGDVEVPAPPSPSSAGIATVSDQILSRLQELGDKMDSMDRRVQKAEAALGQGTSQASSVLNTPQIASNIAVSHSITTDSNVTESVVPSMGFLRGNESLQSQVHKRLDELERINETATKGRNKSQRGGPGEVSVKRMVDWPHNFILTGSRKNRPTYDDLTLTQWVAGFVRCIQEEKNMLLF